MGNSASLVFWYIIPQSEKFRRFFVLVYQLTLIRSFFVLFEQLQVRISFIKLNIGVGAFGSDPDIIGQNGLDELDPPFVKQAVRKASGVFEKRV